MDKEKVRNLSEIIQFAEHERVFRNELTSKLMLVQKDKPAEFCGLVKKMKNRGKSEHQASETIIPSEWLSHFQNLINEKHSCNPSLLQELYDLEKGSLFKFRQ